MSTEANARTGAGVGGAAELGPATMAHADLAEVMGAFNEVTARLSTAHDALRAEVVRLQNELSAANEQLERSRRLAALGEMAAGIAHEVRNPLGSIRLYARMLEQDLADRPSERLIAEKIASATRGLDAVVIDVLAFSKEMSASVERVSAGDVLDRAIEECLADEGLFRTRTGKHAVRVRRHDRPDGVIGASTPDDMDCDTALTHRALVNVVRNAMQAMADDPACTRPTIEVSVERREGHSVEGVPVQGIAIVVRDHGPGISGEVMPRMFNPFFTTRATGTGLGLAIVHRIMDAHSGRVVVRNAGEASDGSGERGAIVELVFPVRVAAPSAPSAVNSSMCAESTDLTEGTVTTGTVTTARARARRSARVRENVR